MIVTTIPKNCIYGVYNKHATYTNTLWGEQAYIFAYFDPNEYKEHSIKERITMDDTLARLLALRALNGGGSTPYVLPIANEDTLGGVKPVNKTSDMSEPVGVDADGRLFTAIPDTGHIIQASNTQTIEGFSCPVISVEQVTTIYNYLVAGESVTVQSEDGDVQFRVVVGDASSGKPTIAIQYYWYGWIGYRVYLPDGGTDDVVEITVYKIPESPSEYIKSASVANNTLTLVDQNNQPISFDPTPEHQITSVTIGTDTIDVVIS